MPTGSQDFRQPTGQFGHGVGPKTRRQFGCPGGGLPDSPIGPNRTRSHNKAAVAPDIYSFGQIAFRVAESPARRLSVKVMLPAPSGQRLAMGEFLVFGPKARKRLNPILFWIMPVGINDDQPSRA
jgi:hypothetical protein